MLDYSFSAWVGGVEYKDAQVWMLLETLSTGFYISHFLLSIWWYEISCLRERAGLTNADYIPVLMLQ